MASKDCPSCGAVVPVEAARCKHCFHDFTEKPKKKSGPLVLLGFLAAMAVVGSGTLWYVYTQRAQERIVVDEETQSIVITRKTASATDTERIAFGNIEKIEHVMGGEKSMFEVVAVTLDGKRYIIKRSDDSPLVGHAEHIASVVDKPMVPVKNVRGFGD